MFKRTNSIRRTLAARDAAAASGIDLRDLELSPTIPPEFMDIHEDLDVVEERLARIRQRQTALVNESEKNLFNDPAWAAASNTPKGSVVELDLRSMIELVDDDAEDDFNRRFDAFASADPDPGAQRWIDSR